MPKYEIEELIQLRETAHVPTSFDFAEFTRAILEQREKQAQADEETGFQGGRRRSSVGVRPKFKTNRPKRAPAPQPDADGWVTLDKQKKDSFGAEGVSEKQKFKESIRDTQVKVRPNNKNISSSKPADPRDIADVKKATFNAFAALESDDEESEEEDDE